MTAGVVVEAAVALLGGLVWNSIYACALFGPVALAVGTLGRNRPALRTALWLLVFVRLLLPPGLAHPWSLASLGQRIGVGSPVSAAAGRSEADGVGLAARDVVAEGATDERAGIRSSWVLVLAGVWLVGAVLVVASQRMRTARFRNIVRTAVPVCSSEVLDTVEWWRIHFGIRRPVRCLTGPGAVPPFTFGLLRPMIFIPQAVLNGRRAWEPAIAHELAHVARWDVLWLTLQQLVHAAYFFHPLVWVSGARLDEARERLCDATVLGVGRLAARDYAGGLLDVLRLDLQATGAPTMRAQKRRIGVRIHSILEFGTGRRPRLAIAAATTALLGVFALPMAAVAPGTPAPPAPPAPEPAPPTVVAPAADVAGPPPVVAPAEAPAMPAVDAVLPAPPETPQASPAPVPVELANPLPDGRVTWAWGPGINPFSGAEVFHRGIDLASPAGTPVLAAEDGVVLTATETYRPQPDSGTVIVVRHDQGIETFYAHLGSLEVSEGQRVDRGEVLGRVGTTGKTTGPHLHFEVWSDGAARDPGEFVSDWR